MEDRAGSDRGEYSPVSIIVITFNEKENIRDCLDSLVELDYPEDKYEIIVVDSSTDRTPQIVVSYRKVRLIRSKKGFATQKNVGLECATFDIVAFTDADCIIPQNWLKIINQAFKNREIAAIGGNAYPPTGTRYFGRCVACMGHPAGGAIGLDANIIRDENGIDFIPGCNAVYRKMALLNAGGFDTYFDEGGEDIDISRRLKEKGYCIDYVPELTIYHKPRNKLFEYVKWNIKVGISKFNLKKLSLFKLVFQPSFLLWSILLFLGVFFLIRIPVLFVASLIMFWLLSIIIPLVFAKPYSLLIKRRRRIGMDLFSIFTVIPFLIYLRQICINIGQIKKWVQTKDFS